MNNTNKRTVYVVGNGKRFLKEKLHLGPFKQAILYNNEHGAEKALNKLINQYADTKQHIATSLERGWVYEYTPVNSEWGQRHLANMRKYIRNSNPKDVKVMKVTVTLG